MKRSHWFLIASLYVTQFLPVAFFFMGLPAILRAQGRSLVELGALYLLGFVWVLKIFWAPLVDRYTLFGAGHYRGWIIAMQAMMIVLLLMMEQMEGTANFPLLLAASFVLTVFAATQDIATDALTVRLLPPDKRSFGNSFQVAGGLLGVMLGGGGALIAYQKIGWSGCFWLMAAVLSITLVQALFVGEPQHEGDGAPPGYGRIVQFWRRPGSGRWAMVMIAMPVGIGMAFGLLTPMLVDAGWTVESVGLAINIAGSLVGLGAVFAMGWLVRRYGRRNMVIAAACLQPPAILALLPLANGKADTVTVLPGLLLVFLIYNPLATVMLTAMMDRCDPRSAGTDFTAQYSLYSFVGFLSGALALTLAAATSYAFVIALSVAIACAAGFLAWLRFSENPEA